jgi:hypothetical protein
VSTVVLGSAFDQPGRAQPLIGVTRSILGTRNDRQRIAKQTDITKEYLITASQISDSRLSISFFPFLLKVKLPPGLIDRGADTRSKAGLGICVTGDTGFQPGYYKLPNRATFFIWHVRRTFSVCGQQSAPSNGVTYPRTCWM